MHPAFTNQTLKLLKQYGIGVPMQINAQKNGLTVPMQLLKAMNEKDDGISSEMLLQFFSEFIEQGYKLDLRDKNGEDIFFQACRFFMNEETPLYRLVDGGSDLDTVNNQGVTPVLMAIEGGSVAFVRYLLLEGAHLDFHPENTMLDPMEIAKRNPHAENMRTFLSEWQHEQVSA